MAEDDTIKVSKVFLDKLTEFYRMLCLKEKSASSLNNDLLGGFLNDDKVIKLNELKNHIEGWLTKYVFRRKKILEHIVETVDAHNFDEGGDIGLANKLAKIIVKSNIPYVLMQTAIAEPAVLPKWKEGDKDTVQLLTEGIAHALNSNLLEQD